MFQNSIGGSSIISVMLQDCVFPVAWFSMWMKCPLHSIQTIWYLGLHFKSHFPGCLFLKYTWSPTWKGGLSLARVFWVAVNLFPLRVFLAIASPNLCVSRCSLPFRWSMMVSMCLLPEVEVLQSVTKPIAILSNGLSGISVICKGYCWTLALSHLQRI